MAIEVIKPGKNLNEEWVYFECPSCKCEFRATMDDVEYGTSFRKTCPNCNTLVFDGKPETEYDKIKELEDWALHGISSCGQIGRK